MAALSVPVQVDAVLFDIDGTLIDSNQLHVRAWDEALREAGHDIAAQAILDQIGKGSDKLVPALLPDARAEECKSIAARHGEIFKARYLDLARPFPEAAALLHRVHDDSRKVVLASSAERAELEHYVELLSVRDILAGTASKDDVDQSKPDPDIFANALAAVDATADQALMVGDSVWDVEGAAKTGIASIALLSGGIGWEKLKGAGAIALYADAAELLAKYSSSPIATA